MRLRSEGWFLVGVLFRWQVDWGYRVVEPDDHILELWHGGELVKVFAQTVEGDRVRQEANDHYLRVVAERLREMGAEGQGGHVDD